MLTRLVVGDPHAPTSPPPPSVARSMSGKEGAPLARGAGRRRRRAWSSRRRGAGGGARGSLSCAPRRGSGGGRCVGRRRRWPWWRWRLRAWCHQWCRRWLDDATVKVAASRVARRWRPWAGPVPLRRGRARRRCRRRCRGGGGGGGRRRCWHRRHRGGRTGARGGGRSGGRGSRPTAGGRSSLRSASHSNGKCAERYPKANYGFFMEVGVRPTGRAASWQPQRSEGMVAVAATTTAVWAA